MTRKRKSASRATRESARVRRKKEEKRNKKAEESAQKKLSKKKKKAEKARVKKKLDKGSNPLVKEIHPYVSAVLPPAADGMMNVELHMKCVKVAAGPRMKPEFKQDMRKMALKGERLLRETMELAQQFVKQRDLSHIADDVVSQIESAIVAEHRRLASLESLEDANDAKTTL